MLKNRTSVHSREIELDNISQRLKQRSYSFPLQRDRTVQRNSSWMLVLEQNNAKRVLGILEHSKNLRTVGYKREKCISVAKRRGLLRNPNIGYEKADIQQHNDQYTSNAWQEANIFQKYSNMFNTEDTRESNMMYKAENSRKTKDMECIQKPKYNNGKADFVKSDSKGEIVEPFITTCCFEISKTAASNMDPDTIFETDYFGKPCIDCKSAVYKRTNIDKAWLPTLQQMGSISGVIHLNGKRTYFRNINKLKKEK